MPQPAPSECIRHAEAVARSYCCPRPPAWPAAAEARPDEATPKKKKPVPISAAGHRGPGRPDGGGHPAHDPGAADDELIESAAVQRPRDGAATGPIRSSPSSCWRGPPRSSGSSRRSSGALPTGRPAWRPTRTRWARRSCALPTCKDVPDPLRTSLRSLLAVAGGGGRFAFDPGRAQFYHRFRRRHPGRASLVLADVAARHVCSGAPSPTASGETPAQALAMRDGRSVPSGVRRNDLRRRP